jgi:trans-aconitate 2-methyltransferase
MIWDPGQYLKYSGERMRPALDLLARIPLSAARAVVDLGCGSGNTAQMLGARWPDAMITGVDSSLPMLARARTGTAGQQRFRWQESDIARWQPDAPVDLLFSNAALHWLDDHAQLFPRLFAQVVAGGVLAVQMPDNFAAPSHVALHDTVTSARWRARLASRVRPTPVASAVEYFGWLAPGAESIDLWTTEYLHVLPAGDGIEHPVVAWTRGSALTPFLALLDAEATQAFLDDYGARIAAAYPRLSDGRVLFPFRRRFVVAVRANVAGSQWRGLASDQDAVGLSLG